MDEILGYVLNVGFFAAVIRIATPLILATIGELYAERSGVLNLGIEGTMLLGAMIGFSAAFFTGSLWLGVAAAMLAEHPNLKGLLCCNDSMALGAVAAVNAAGKKGQVLVVGFDSISAIQQALEDKSVLATADQFGDQLAVFGIEYALQLLKDPSATPKDKETPVDLVLPNPPPPKI